MRRVTDGLLKDDFVNAAYYDRLADTYDDLYLDPVSTAENLFVQSRLAERFGSSKYILDIGCGTGLGLRLLRAGGFEGEYVGVDISEKMVRAAQRNTHDPRATFLVCDATKYLETVLNNSFDGVTSLFGSFSHLADQGRAANNIHRVCTKGGTIFIMCYSIRPLSLIRVSDNGLYINNRRETDHYNVRNHTSDSSYSIAHFYSSDRLAELFKDFSQHSVVGLNAILAYSGMQHDVHSRSVDNIVEFLKHESDALKTEADLCHSLIFEGQKDR